LLSTFKNKLGVSGGQDFIVTSSLVNCRLSRISSTTTGVTVAVSQSSGVLLNRLCRLAILWYRGLLPCTNKLTVHSAVYLQSQ